MSVEVIAIGGYEEVGKSISAKPLEKVSSKFNRTFPSFIIGGTYKL